MTALLAVLVLVLLLVLSIRRAMRRAGPMATAASAPSATQGLYGRRARRQPPGRSLPPGHQPPPGLGPLSPSERFLTAEAARGLLELQVFLLERPA